MNTYTDPDDDNDDMQDKGLGCFHVVFACMWLVAWTLIIFLLISCAAPTPTVVKLEDGKKVLTVTVPPTQNNTIAFGADVLTFLKTMMPAL